LRLAAEGFPLYVGTGVFGLALVFELAISLVFGAQ
jgi:hypothetical protein